MISAPCPSRCSSCPMALKTSAWRIVLSSVKRVNTRFYLSTAAVFLSFSTKKQWEAPLERASIPMPPVPEKRSAKVQPPRYGESMLKSVSLILSWVGREESPGTDFSGRLRRDPAITLILEPPIQNILLIITVINTPKELPIVSINTSNILDVLP